MLPCKSTKLASYLPSRRFQLRCWSHFQLYQIFKMMFFSSCFPVFPKRFTRFLKIRERGSRILKTVNNLSYANIHIVILLSLCRNISFMYLYLLLYLVVVKIRITHFIVENNSLPNYLHNASIFCFLVLRLLYFWR